MGVGDGRWLGVLGGKEKRETGGHVINESTESDPKAEMHEGVKRER